MREITITKFELHNYDVLKVHHPMLVRLISPKNMIKSIEYMLESNLVFNPYSMDTYPTYYEDLYPGLQMIIGRLSNMKIVSATYDVYEWS